MTNSKYSEAITSKFRNLEVTFDGDLIDAIRCKYIISAIEKDNLLNKVNKFYLYVPKLVKSFLNYRTAGHLIAFDFDTSKKRSIHSKLIF